MYTTLDEGIEALAPAPLSLLYLANYYAEPNNQALHGIVGQRNFFCDSELGTTTPAHMKSPPQSERRTPLKKTGAGKVEPKS